MHPRARHPRVLPYTEYDELPADAMRFHAQWRRERVTELARDYVVLDCVLGRGAYIGIVTTPAYMLAQNIAEAASGIDKLVSRVLVLAE